jgi:Transcription factor WhiB
VDTHNFINAVAADDLHLALEPITPPPGPGACATHDPRRFASPQRQQAAFDGDPINPVEDYKAARAICLECPLLAACRRYAEASREEDTFLAGSSPDQRRARRRKQAEIAKRRLRVDALRALGAPTSVIADLVGRDASLVRGDLRALKRQAGPATRSDGSC